ncbi:MAG: response regulator [Rhodocyclales bacterium]|nr:response regulator [Rhodocyclales bacterium]
MRARRRVRRRHDARRTRSGSQKGRGVLNYRILVVDDEELNRRIIAEFLDDATYCLDMAVDGEDAWEKLQQSQEPYHLIVLDRMMPRLDGLELLKRLKHERRYREIPVIMQTAAASSMQIAEGIEAGAYYYLTKPYTLESLVTIVRAALVDVAEKAEAEKRVRTQADALRLAVRAEFEYRNIDEANSLAGLLAHLCPDPDKVALGLTELLVNAVEHGNLGITYEEKSRLRREDRWEEEVKRRSQLPEFRQRFVVVRAEKSPQAVVYTVTDQGAGFDWERYLRFDTARAFDPNGRGIAMARMTSFDRLEYRGCGNEVMAVIDLDGRPR